MIVEAQPRDLGQIWLLRQERAQWLAEHGSDQWSDAGLDRDSFLDRVRTSINRGETWIYLHDGDILGTIAIDHWADTGLWTPDQMNESVIVHRMITPRSSAGSGIGTTLLAWADIVAAHQHRPWVRLDAWSANTGLHGYYRRQGFEHVRTADEHRTPSGALFQRPVTTRRIDSARPRAANLGDGGDNITIYTLPTWHVAFSTPQNALIRPGFTCHLTHLENSWRWNGLPITSTDDLLNSLDPNQPYQVKVCRIGCDNSVMLIPETRQPHRGTPQAAADPVGASA